MARLSLAGLLVLLTWAALAAPALAATCAYDATAGRVSVLATGAGEAVTVRRGADGALLANDAPCGAATVANTNDIALTGGAGAQRLVLDLGGGPFAPGRTAESGTAEIEIHVDGAAGTGDGLVLTGTAGPDVLRFGTSGVALNGDADADVDLQGLEYLAADGGAGMDQLLGDGGAGSGTATALPLRLTGGTENDSLQGGGGQDVLNGDAGNDRVLGGASDDELIGGDGNDDVRGEKGNDLLPQPAARDGRDFLIGGDDIDHVSYAARAEPVEVTLDAAANDGTEAATSEGDNVSAERVSGGAGDDTLTGDVGANTLLGGPGTDVLLGGQGADRLDGGAGPDQMNGEGGRDVIDYSSRATAVTVTLDPAAATGDDGQAGEGDRALADDVIGGAGADKLTGDAEANSLDGGAGNDVLEGGLGADVLTGGIGNDTASYAARTEALTIRIDGTANDGAANEADNVTTSVENVLGGTGNDWLRGNSLPNRLRGGTGDDRLGADGGADVLEGGTGKDIADYGGRTTPVALTLDGLTNDGGDAGGDGTAEEGDRIALDVEIVQGGAGADRLAGSSIANELRGGGGPDLLSAADGGADVLRGGSGIDTATYAARPATHAIKATIDGIANDGTAGSGTDNVALDVENLTGHDGRDELHGSGEANVLAGGAGTDRLHGLGGNDRLEDAGGVGHLFGGPGDDTFAAADGDAADTLDGGDGTDGGQWDAGDTLTGIP